MYDSLPRNRRTGAFERRVARVLDRHCPPGGALVVACSGGPDSTAALVATARWAHDREVSVTAACFDHRLRPREETAGDRAAVEDVASRLRIGFVAGTAPRRPTANARGVEDAARSARYRWLARACREADAHCCVVGHTLNDQAETVLLRLSRGTGLTGAAGMAELAPWPIAGGRGLSVVRPLLEITRVEVEAYLDALGLEARRDPSNETLDYDRNRVRHRVLPELRNLNPRADESLARFAALAREDDAALETWAASEAASLVRFTGRARSLEARLERRALGALPAAVAARVLRLAARRLGIDLEAAQIERLVGVARTGRGLVSLAHGHGRADGSELVLSRTSGGQPLDQILG